MAAPSPLRPIHGAGVTAAGTLPHVQPPITDKEMKQDTIDRTRRWKVIESEYVYRRPWLTARRERLQLPDGRIVPEYYVLDYPEWVNVIAITTEGDFVMERQYRHGAGVTCYELPCGVAEEGETPLQAAQRELEEETGYTGGEWSEVMTISANPGSMSNMTHCFLARGVEKTTSPHLDSTEELTVHLLSRDTVRHLLETNQILQALMAAPLWRYFSLMEKP